MMGLVVREGLLCYCRLASSSASTRKTAARTATKTHNNTSYTTTNTWLAFPPSLLSQPALTPRNQKRRWKSTTSSQWQDLQTPSITRIQPYLSEIVRYSNLSMAYSFRLPIFAGEAFMARHLPDLGQEVEDVQVYTWPINNWRKQDKKVTGPEFECGGHRWSEFPQPLSASETWLTRI